MRGKNLRAHYNRQEHPGLNDDQIFAEREEKFATLLFEISQVLDYKFGRTHIRDNVYRPQLHGRFDEIERETRTRVLTCCETMPCLFDLLQHSSGLVQSRFLHSNNRVRPTQRGCKADAHIGLLVHKLGHIRRGSGRIIRSAPIILSSNGLGYQPHYFPVCNRTCRGAEYRAILLVRLSLN